MSGRPCPRPGGFRPDLIASSTDGAFALLVALVGAGPARASTPTVVSGTWDWDNLTWVTEKVVGGNEFFSGKEVSARTGWSGDFEGTSFDTFAGVFHKNGTGDGRLIVYFVGSVLGHTGTMIVDASFLANRGHGFAGTWFIRSGTGELEGLHGNGAWGDRGGALVEYDGQVHWD